jgi:anti-anti-sigma regulatory factor
MSFRIERLVAGDASLIFQVSGRMEGENLAILQGVLAQTTGEVALDLNEVTFVDRHAVTLLALCERRGVELKNLQAYLRDWISKEQAQIRGG